MAKKRDLREVHYAAAVFKALGHPERLRIVCTLADGGTCTQTQLAELLDRPQSTVARHLAPLRALGLVSGERDGVEVPLTLSDSLTQELLDAVCTWIHPGERRIHAFNALIATEGEYA